MNLHKSNWQNKITRLLGIEYPIVQAPMLGVTTAEMVAAAAKAHCLGSLPLGDFPAEKCVELIKNTRRLTDREFAVNIFANDIPPLTEELKNKYTQAKIYIEELAKMYGIEVSLPEIESFELNSYHGQIDAVISEKCKILSFTFGNLDKESIDRLKSHGVILIGTCTSVAEARVLEKTGIDIICVQGIEAGGHRGSFMGEHIPQIGGLSLLSQINDNVEIPIIYAGGIYDAKTIQATQALGAQGFQVGSLLLGSVESALGELEKQRLREIDERDIVLTKSFSGRFARGIQNIFTASLDNTKYILPYPYQNKLTFELRKLAKKQGNTNFMSIWTGQSIMGYRYSGQSTTEILKELISQAEHEKVLR